MKRLALYILLLCSVKIFAQSDSSAVKSTPKDTLTFGEHFSKADWILHSRTFFMSTINEGALKDDYALATGLTMGFVSRPLYGFQVGVAANFIYNIASSNIWANDPLTNQPNRYETGLFDLQRPNYKAVILLQKLYMRYTLSKSSIEAGRIDINNPFINAQDGRMRPTAQEGAWLSVKELKKVHFNAGFIWALSPRSTGQWYKVEQSVGLYPVGVNANGTKSNYYGNIKSKGIALFNVAYMPMPACTVNVWNMYFENVTNTAMVEVVEELPLEKTYFKPHFGLMFIRQDAVKNGGNADTTKAYIQKGTHSNIVSVQFGLKGKRISINLNYTLIKGNGQYLMPREWGRDVFYTFMPRERNEGLGGVNAVTLRTSYTNKTKNVRAAITYGYFNLPDVKSYSQNKYGMPTYHQLNYEFGYAFGKYLKGLEIKMLIAQKLNGGETYDNPRYIYNRVNMVNFNLVVDFKL